MAHGGVRTGVAVFVAGASLLSGSASAYVGTVEVVPPHPRAGDAVVASIDGDFPNGCWRFAGHTVRVSGDRIHVDVFGDRVTIPGVLCLQVLIPYALAVPLGTLGAGRYELVVSDPQDSKTVVFEVAATGARTLPGDSNGDGQVDISDGVFTLLYLFSGGPAPGCARQADSNSDGTVDVSDAIHLLGYLFLGGPRPPGWSGCYAAGHCALRPWEIFCTGHWECVCGECHAACESSTCGDGVCDVEGGETPASCAADCEKAPCRPVCSAIGSRSEGWYDSCSGGLIEWALCGPCRAVCLRCGSEGEGWYDSCTLERILAADCDCAN